MRFLVDRCAGRRLAQWLSGGGHDVVDMSEAGATHAGLVRPPDVPPAKRMALMQRILDLHAADVERGAVITVRGDRIRVSRSD